MCFTIPQNPAFKPEAGPYTIVYKIYTIADGLKPSDNPTYLRTLHGYTANTFPLISNTELVSSRKIAFVTREEEGLGSIHKGFHAYRSRAKALNIARENSTWNDRHTIVVALRGKKSDFVAKNDSEMVFTKLTIDSVAALYNDGKKISHAATKKSISLPAPVHPVKV